MKRTSLKFIIFSLSFFFLGFSAFADDIFVQKTKFFDIIYTKESETSAALVAEYADGYAEEIAKKLNKRLPWRMPVYIMPNKEVLNAYFTPIPYFRIVLFDTVPTEGELTNLNNNILKVFYHELTHAISLLYYLPVLPLSFDEGVAVLLESSDGQQGRLNDPIIQHHLMQGRIDGKSPSWKQAAGHRDVYPGAFWGYIYGASFADYLKEIYGMETYAKYWNSSFFIFPKSKTKKIFNKKLPELWNNFIESIYIPENLILANNFLEKHNKSGFKVLANNKDGFACFDFAKKEVSFFTRDAKKTKLFNANPTLMSLSFSEDGNLLIATDFIYSLKGETSRAFIYDMSKKKILKKEIYGLRYASFLGNDKICGIKVNHQFSELVVMDLNDEKNKNTLIKFGPGMVYSAIYNPVRAGKDQIAFIAANGLKRDILLINTKSKELTKLEFNNDLPAIRYLQTNGSIDNPVLTFSWAGENMLYRSAICKLKKREYKILEKDVSGGVFNSLYFEDLNNEDKSTNQEELFYIGVHSKYNSLYKINESEFSKVDKLKLKKISLVALEKYNQDKKLISKKAKLDILTFDKYNYASWLCRPLPLPIIKFVDGTDGSKKTAFGIRLHGMDATETMEFITYSLFYVKPFFYETSVDFRFKNIQLSVYDLNVDFHHRKLGSRLGIKFILPTDLLYQNFLFSADTSFDSLSFIPQNEKLAKTLYEYKFTDYVLTEELSSSYSFLKTKHNLDTNFFTKDKMGVDLSAGVKHAVNFRSKTNSLVLQTKFSAFTPVLPYRFSFGSYFGYNSFFNPITGSYTFFDNSSLLGMSAYLPKMQEYGVLKNHAYKKPGKMNFGFSLDNEIDIFSYDTQVGSSFLYAFYNRINASLGYRVVFNFLNGANKNNLDIYQAAYTKLTLDISSIINLGVEYAHPIEKVKMGKFNLVLNINY